jgi:hypothetical protein
MRLRLWPPPPLGVLHLVIAFVLGVVLTWAAVEMTMELRGTGSDGNAAPPPGPAPPRVRYVYLPNNPTDQAGKAVQADKADKADDKAVQEGQTGGRLRDDDVMRQQSAQPPGSGTADVLPRFYSLLAPVGQ